MKMKSNQQSDFGAKAMAVKPAASHVITYKARASVEDGDLSEYFSSGIGKAVFRGNSISFDWQDDGKPYENTHLTTVDGVHFTGRSIPGLNADYTTVATVEAVLYSNRHGHVLVGEWCYEDGSEQAIVVQFIGGQAVATNEEEDRPKKRKFPKERRN